MVYVQGKYFRYNLDFIGCISYACDHNINDYILHFIDRIFKISDSFDYKYSVKYII